MINKRKKLKLKAENVNKNSGKEISHTITKIKEHEKLYTWILVFVFLVTIISSIFIGLSGDRYKLYDASYYNSNFSVRGQLIALSSKNVLTDEEGLKSATYQLEYSNNTMKNINFLLRFALDEETVERCQCKDQIVSYEKIKYSIDGENVKQFTDETMIITTGMIPARKSDSIKIHIWLDDSLKDENCLYYGKLMIEQLEDMDD